LIQDNLTNTLYLADCLPSKYPEFYGRLETILKNCQVDFHLLPHSKDIWAVDYMPIQINDNQFIQFTYNPDYLKPAQWHNTITNTDAVCKAIKINTIKSHIVIDGGNICKSAHKVIMCDKVFKENPTYKSLQLIGELENLLQIDQLIIVPQDVHDFTGHADGMVRFLNETTVLINDYSKESLKFQSEFLKAIRRAGLQYIEVPYCPDWSTKDSAKGLYINYLEMSNLLLLPVFGIQEDEVAVRLFESIFPHHTIITIESNAIASQGGVLNCISWNIKT